MKFIIVFLSMIHLLVSICHSNPTNNETKTDGTTTDEDSQVKACEDTVHKFYSDCKDCVKDERLIQFIKYTIFYKEINIRYDEIFSKEIESGSLKRYTDEDLKTNNLYVESSMEDGVIKEFIKAAFYFLTYHINSKQYDIKAPSEECNGLLETEMIKDCNTQFQDAHLNRSEVKITMYQVFFKKMSEKYTAEETENNTAEETENNTDEENYIKTYYLKIKNEMFTKDSYLQFWGNTLNKFCKQFISKNIQS